MQDLVASHTESAYQATPLIDVMLVLMVVFLMRTPVSQESTSTCAGNHR